MNTQNTPPPPGNPPPVPPQVQYVLASYPPPPEDDEINLLDFWRVLMRYKLMIIVITLLATAAAVTMALIMTPTYRAEVLLAPVSDDEQGAMSAISNQFGGLASFAGINLDSGASSTDQALATLTSRRFINDFIAEKKLMPVLFADKWDATSKTWKVKSSADEPTMGIAYEAFKNILSVSPDKKSGLVTLAVEWQDPGQAAAWANELVLRINDHEKQLAIKETEQSLAYLKEQLPKTSVMEVQQAIYRLIEAQTKKIMLANVRDQFAFKVIDPAVVPEKRAKPNRKLIVGVGIMLGLAGGILLAFLVSAIRRQSAEGVKECAK